MKIEVEVVKMVREEIMEEEGNQMQERDLVVGAGGNKEMEEDLEIENRVHQEALVIETMKIEEILAIETEMVVIINLAIEVVRFKVTIEAMMAIESQEDLLNVLNVINKVIFHAIAHKEMNLPQNLSNSIITEVDLSKKENPHLKCLSKNSVTIE